MGSGKHLAPDTIYVLGDTTNIVTNTKVPNTSTQAFKTNKIHLMYFLLAILQNVVAFIYAVFMISMYLENIQIT